ncbi:MAG: SurA N-terminal domain-containing protein [Aestuariivirgaceae bacterium]|nr:SurA N-terminal domain-containing protein [Aestuariivirgaceae bacterium]
MNKMMNHISAWIGVLLAAFVVVAASLPAHSAGTVIVIVNDRPITAFDIDQRIKISELLGDAPNANTRPKVLQELINDVLKRTEAQRFRAMPSTKQVDEAMARLAKNSGINQDGFAKQLKAKGVNLEAVRTQVATTMAFNRLIGSKYNVRNIVDEAEVTRRLEQFKRDPRMKPTTVYKLQEIMLPVENVGAMSGQLLMARAVEAQQVMSRYTGCASAKKAGSGIFNVKVGKPFEADAARLPKDLKAALDKAGTKRLVGPIQGQQGIQLIGLCSKNELAPAPPTRQQVETLIMNEKYASYEERYVKELRRSAFIDYKDKSYQPKN